MRNEMVEDSCNILIKVHLICIASAARDGRDGAQESGIFKITGCSTHP